MGASLEKAQKKETLMKQCLQGCPGHTRSDIVTRVFQRTESLVEVILENIPAEVCQMCGRAFFSKEVVRGIDRVLLPFHGTHRTIPDLPPARIIVDFVEAQKKVAA